MLHLTVGIVQFGHQWRVDRSANGTLSVSAHFYCTDRIVSWVWLLVGVPETQTGLRGRYGVRSAVAQSTGENHVVSGYSTGADRLRMALHRPTHS